MIKMKESQSIPGIGSNGVPTELFHSNLEQEGDKKVTYKITALLIKENSKVLDYGCGKCGFFDRIKGRFNNIRLVGYDIDKYYVDIGREKGYEVYDSLNKIKGKFDYVVCEQVIEHLNVDQANLFF